MMLHVDLDAKKLKKLEAMAARLNVSVNDLAKAAIQDLLNKPEDDFEEAATRVLDKNAELYRRFSR